MIKTGWENQQLSNLFLFYRNYWNSVKRFLPLNGVSSFLPLTEIFSRVAEFYSFSCN